MPNIGIPELLIILAILLLLFGGARLAGLGKSTGRALREFKQETKDLNEKDGDAPRSLDNPQAAQPQQPYAQQPYVQQQPQPYVQQQPQPYVQQPQQQPYEQQQPPATHWQQPQTGPVQDPTSEVRRDS